MTKNEYKIDTINWGQNNIYIHSCMFTHTYIHSYIHTYMSKISRKYFHKLCMNQMQEYIWKEIIMYR